MNLTSPNEIKKLMESHGLRFQKAFGQNFLISAAIVSQIAEQCGAMPEDGILEIGPGIGSLTVELCQRYAKVVSVEIDSGLIPVLGETAGVYPNFTLIHEDILKLPLKETIEKEFGERRVAVCANLPYYITTPILMALLESKIPFRAITVMVQKEVAKRLAAAPGSAEYGAITVSVNRYGTVKKRFLVTSGNFMPAPKVDSCVISILPYENSPYAVRDEVLLTRLIAAAFSQRRKTLVNALSSQLPGLTREAAEDVLRSLGFSETVRGETLSIGDFARLTEALTDRVPGL